jgi:Ribbon-helix-helix domain
MQPNDGLLDSSERGASMARQHVVRGISMEANDLAALQEWSAESQIPVSRLVRAAIQDLLARREDERRSSSGSQAE